MSKSNPAVPKSGCFKIRIKGIKTRIAGLERAVPDGLRGDFLIEEFDHFSAGLLPCSASQYGEHFGGRFFLHLTALPATPDGFLNLVIETSGEIGFMAALSRVAAIVLQKGVSK